MTRLVFAPFTLAALATVRAITVAEEPGGTYPMCTDTQLAAFNALIADEYNDCASRTMSDWDTGLLPTLKERQDLCQCTPLINKLQTVKAPHCAMYRTSLDDPKLEKYSYKKLIEYSFGLCATNDTGSTLAPSTTTPTSTTTTPTSTTTKPLMSTPETTSVVPAPTTKKPQSPSGNDSLPTDTLLTNSPASVTKAPSRDADTSASSSDKQNKSTTGIIVGAVVAIIAAAVVAAFIVRKRQKSKPHEPHVAEVYSPLSQLGECEGTFKAMPPIVRTSTIDNVDEIRHSTPATTGSSTPKRRSTHDSRTTPPAEMAMWEDPVLLAVRVPYDTVFFGPLLSRGGYGEVYKATYRGETVAIKQLLPERRKDLAQIDAFLHEVKLMSTLEHERIVRFIGVAWHALSDACVIVEYMENGDLRTVLTKWDREEHRRQGFDADKVKIALHVAHALTYLHSLQPVVVHRDLKSKNILLDANYDVKLTDFGVSRERADSTMTGGVGTSLWMAPEVMLGERYDEKADVFSFGVVLSELDTQKLPYARVKEAEAGHKLPDSAILQMVSLGRLQVTFTDHAHPDLVLLGRDCVQLEAKKRPTSAEVLHLVHQVLRSF